MLGSEQLDPQSINRRFSRQCKEAANRHFADLVPPRMGEDDLYMHLFRAVYATLAVYYYCPPRVNGILFKAEIQGHRMIATTTDKETLRSYTASRHYDDYAIADRGNVDGRRGLRLGEPGVQVLEVLQTTPEPVSTAPTKTIPMPKPAKTPKSTKPPARHWRISEAAHRILSKDWTLNKDEHQSEVLDRAIAFAGVAKKLASIMELPVGQIAPDALLAAATTRFEALSGNLKETADQMAQLKAQHDASQRTVALLTSERDALSARVAALQAELKDAATRHAPPVELLPFARRVLELSSHAGTLPPAELQSSLMRLAIDAITQAEGAAPAAVSTPTSPAPAPNRSQKPATTPATPLTATALPTTQPTQHTTTTPQSVNAPAPENVTSVVDHTPDGQNGQDVNISAAPPAEKNRNTAKAEAKLEKALAYLATLNTTATAKPDKWVVNASILASMTGCYRPAINAFIEARKQNIDELNAAHGLGPGHNRAKARTHPNAIPELVKRFKEEVLGQPF